MPQISNLSFNVSFEAHNPNRVVITNTTPSLPAGFVGIVKITQPDGYVRTGDIDNPDLTNSVLSANIPIVPDSAGKLQQGQYSIELIGLAPGYLSTSFIRTFTLTYKPTDILLRNDFDLFTPQLAYTDISNYNVSGYTLSAGPTRSWTATSPTTGAITSTNSSIDIKKNNQYYAENYVIQLSVAVSYASQSYPWLTVSDVRTASAAVTACKPKSIEQLTQAVDALRIESNASCGADWAKFEKANALYTHLINMLRLVLVAGEYQEGFFDVYQQLLSQIQNGVVSCDSIGQVIPAYDFSDYESSIYDGESSYCQLVGDGVNTVYRVNHQLGDDCVVAQVYEVATGKQVLCDLAIVTINSIDITFYEPPTTGQYRVVVVAGAIGLRGQGFQPGGLAGQILRKKTDADFDTEWANVSAALPELVPYVGAERNVDLGEYGISAGYVKFDTTPTGTPAVPAVMSWNDQEGTVDLRLKGNNVTLQVGQEMLARVVNKTGANLLGTQYKAVRVRKVSEGGAQGQRLAVVLAQGNSEIASTDMLGLVTENIDNNQEGFITTFGTIRGINTTGSLQGETWVDGDILFVSPTVPGGLTKVKPSAPNHLIIVGYVEYAHQSNGKIFVHVQTSYELEELHNVAISSPASGQFLRYNGTLWENSTFNAVSSVGLATTTPGVTVTNTPVTGSGVININIATASAGTNGLLSASDWAAFNAKQAAISLTTNGSTGAATFVNNVLNIPTYSLSSLGGVPSSRTLSINGTVYDLTADRAWSVGSVTSITFNGPLTGGTITGSGTVSLPKATTSVDGYLSATDWTYFNNKQNALTFGSITSNTSGLNISSGAFSTVGPNVTVSIETASSTQNGLLSSTDWSTFNAKQGAISLTTSGTGGASTFVGNTLNIPVYQSQGNYITSLSGEATAAGPGAATITLSNAAVTGKVLTGLTVTGTSISATDSILSALGKLQGQVNSLVGGLKYQGTWNASTNTPTITSSTGTGGHFYIVSVAGSTSVNGISDWKIGDWIVYDGTSWQKVDNTESVVSVNGLVGAVTLTTSEVSEGTNLYFTNARARQAISLTTTGTSGAATYDNVTGVLNVPQYSLSSLGGVPSTRTLTINGTAFDLSADRAWSVGTVTSVAALTIGTAGTDITSTVATGTTTPVITLNIPTASAANRGVLSAADWTTFNSKVGGTGTVNYVPKFTAAGTIGNSQIFDNGTNVGIGDDAPASKLSVNGTIRSVVASGTNIFSIRTSDVWYSALSAEGLSTLTNTNDVAPMIFRTGSNERLRIFANGRVGINTGATDAGYQLDVNGTLRTVNGANFATTSGSVGVGTASPVTKFHMSGGQATFSTSNFNDASAGGAVKIFSDDNNGGKIWAQKDGNQAWGYLALQPLGGNVGIGTSAPLQLFSVKTNTSESVGIQDQTGYGSLVYKHATTGAFRDGMIDANNLLLQTQSGGRVGIGTVSPAYLLEAYKNGLVDIVANSAADNNSAYISTFNSGGTSGNFAQLRAYGNTTGGLLFGSSTNKMISLFSNGDSMFTIGTISGTPLAFGTANVERMRVSPAGNILIGLQSDAGQTLQVFGTARVTQSAYFATVSGSVGIGTTSPNAKLEVSGTSAGTIGAIMSTDTSGTTSFLRILGDAASQNLINWQTGTSLRFATSTQAYGTFVERMRITDAGVVTVANLAGSGARVVVADASGNLSATALSSSVTTGSGTTNYITKWTGTSTQGNSQIFDNGTNVGIGIAAGMSERFNVANSSGNANASISTSSATSGAFLRFGNSVNADGLYIGYNNPAGTLLGGVGGANSGAIVGYGAYPLGFGTNGTERLRIFANGRVFVGASPTDAGYQFDVNGSIRSTSTIRSDGNFYNESATPQYSARLNTVDGQRINMEISGTDGRIQVTRNSGTQPNLVFATEGGEKMRISAGGNVGINQNNPSYLLDVNGTLRSVNGANFATTSGNVGIGTASPANNGANTTTLTINGTNQGILQLQNAGTKYFEFYASGTDTRFENVAGNDLTFRNGSTVNARITSAGELLINTTSDAGDYKLQVAGGIYVTGNAANAAIQMQSGQAIRTDGSAYFDVGTSGSGIFNLRAGSSGNNAMYVHNNGRVGFNTNVDNGYLVDVFGTLRTTNGANFATASGNVGIGTATPSAKLTVVGSGAQTVLNSGAASDARIEFQYNSVRKGAISWDTDNVRLFTDVGNYLTFWTAGVEAMRITTSGHVGIGVTPSTWSTSFDALQIGNSTSLYDNATGNGTFLGSNYFYNGTNNIYLTSNPANAYALFSGEHRWLTAASGTAGSIVTFTQAMTLTSAGNLGIGTTSPALRLQSNSTGAAAPATSGISQVGALRLSNNYNAVVLDYGFDISNNVWMQATNRDDLSFKYPLLINPNGGNVGVGTQSPASILHVQNSTPTVTIRNSVIADATQGAANNLSAGMINFGANGTFDVVGSIETKYGADASFGRRADMIFSTRNTTSFAERMRITSAGSVGIGTETPTSGYLLDVRGRGKFVNSTGYALDLVGSGNGEFKVYVDTNESNLISDASMKLTAGGAERIRIFANGRVFVGPSPADAGYQLDVNGAVRTGDLRINSSTGFNTLFTQGIGGGGLAMVSTTDPGSAGQRLYSLGFGSLNYPAQARIEALSTEAWSATNRGSSLRFNTTPNGTTGSQIRMYIENDGFVGINTQTPLARLHVAGNMRSDNDAYFATANGSVGIGTTTPIVKLDVNGSGIFRDITYIARDSAPNDANVITLRQTAGTDATLGALYFNTELRPSATGANRRVDIYAGDNVGFRNINFPYGSIGIGTTSPGSKLDVVGDITATTGFVTSYRASGESQIRVALLTNQMYMFNNSTSYGLYGSDYGGLFSRNKSTGLLNIYDRAYIASDGSVGIGTASPGSILDVSTGAASGSIQNSMRLTQTGTAANSGQRIQFFNSQQSWEQGAITSLREGANANFSMIFSTAVTGANTPRMLITSDGNVGIGNTSAYYRLHISQPKNTTGLFITSSGELASNDYTQIAFGFDAYNTVCAAVRAVAQNPAASFNHHLTFHTYENTLQERMRIFANGRVFIGASPVDAGYQLDVSGNTRVTGKIDVTSNTTFGLGVARAGTSEAAGQIFNSNGVLYFGAESSAGGAIFTGSSAYAAVVGSGANYALQFATNNTVRSTITNDGKLLVGTASSFGSFNLQATGNAYIGGNVQINPTANQTGIFMPNMSWTGSNASSAINISGTLNTTGTPSLIYVDISDVASNAETNFMQFVNSTTKFRVTKQGDIQTAAPTGGTANKWKLGSVVSTTVTMVTSQYVEVEIGGSLYRLALVTPA